MNSLLSKRRRSSGQVGILSWWACACRGLMTTSCRSLLLQAGPLRAHFFGSFLLGWRNKSEVIIFHRYSGCIMRIQVGERLLSSTEVSLEAPSVHCAKRRETGLADTGGGISQVLLWRYPKDLVRFIDDLRP